MGWDGPLTERQFEAWQWWLRLQWDKPSRTDHELMRLAAGINNLIAVQTGKEPPEVKQLEFRWQEQPQVKRKRKPKVATGEGISHVTLVDLKTGQEIVHKAPQRLDKAGVQRVEQMYHLWQLSQSGARKQ